MQPIMIIGCGDIGLRIAKASNRRGRIVALVRSRESARRAERLGLSVVQGDLDVQVPADDRLKQPGALVHYTVPPPREGQGDPRLARFLDAMTATPPKRIVYISTSAVYGNCDGEWVDEERAPSPDTDRGRRRLAAERLLQDWCQAHQASYVILRVPGIYGPGRLPIKRLRSGAPLVDERECPYSNRIHADDLASVCVAAANKAPDNRIYNVSDGHPTSMTDYFLQVADLLNIDPPEIISLDEAREVLSPAMLSFLDESKRLSNQRMLKELDIKLRYPTLAEGLAASLAEEA